MRGLTTIAACMLMAGPAFADTPAEFDADVQLSELMVGVMAQGVKCGFRNEAWEKRILASFQARVMMDALETKTEQTFEQRDQWAQGKLREAYRIGSNPTADQCHDLAAQPWMLRKVEEVANQ